MVATVSSNPKKCPPNIRTGAVHAPVLVSPISVAHGNAMMGVEGSKKGANWMRDQWVANLKKKRMGSGPDGTGDGAPSASSGLVPTVKAGIRAESSRSNGDKPAPASRSKRTTKSKTSTATANNNTIALNQVAPVDKDNLSLIHPAMFFNDLGCFELESPSFMRLTPTTRDGSVSGAMASPATGTTTATATTSSCSSSTKTEKKWMKPLMKKRSSCFSSDADSEPKRRTPRRPNPSSGSFDDSDHSSLSSPHSYTTSVGTPSNFNNRMWGPELDFPTGYVDTFLDLPTPKSSDMPGGGMYGAPSSSSSSSITKPHHQQQSATPRNTNNQHDLEQPKLIRTTSIEQEGLSLFLEHTTLSHDSNNNHDNNNNNNNDESQTFLRLPSKSSKQQPHPALSHAVDTCFGGKVAPSPLAHHHLQYTSFASTGRTPKGAMPRPSSSDLSRFDPVKNSNNQTTTATTMASSSSEFDTLVQEYEFTDFDQELDSFYLDTIESFGGDLDLISN